MEETNEIQEKISQRIRQREAGKEFKDTSVVNYTRKYSASYDIVTSQDLTKIEADNVTAYKLIEKSKIWPAYNIEELKQAGNTSGAAYLKVKCRESLGSRPIDSKDARETYVRNIEKLRLQLESGKTFEEVSGILKSFVNLDAFEFGKLPDNLRSSSYISTTYTGNLKTFYRRDVEDYFSKIFGKRFYSFCDGSSDFSKKSGVESRLIERFTKEMEDAAVLQRENQLNKRVSEYERMIEAVTNAEDNRDSIRTAIYSINKYAGVSRYEKQFVLDELKKQIESSKKTLLSVRENLPAYFKAREDDWSWAGIKKEKKASEKKDSLDVVAKAPESIFEKYGIEDWKKKSKRTPLSHIKRTGGLTVDSVQVNEVVDKFGFKNVVFGNYVNNEERREHLKHFLGALLDLHEIINFDIKEINGLGGLDINFGSTGCGSFSNAMACYFPALKAINLTKKRGDGSIAHEWSHYLDNVIGEGTERRAKDSIYATYLKTIYKDSEKVKMLFSEFKNWLHTGGKKRPVFVKFYPQRKYMFRMYGDTVESAGDAIQKKYPNYRKYENADTADLLKYYGYVAYKLNEGKPIVIELETSASEYYYVSSLYNDGTGYWTSIKELFARAFEWFVEDALVLQKRSNNYLVDTTNALGLLALIIPYNQHPYPRTPEDQSFLRDWFDRLFSAIRTEYNIKPFHWDTTEREDEFSQYAPGDTEKIETGVVVDSDGDTEGLGAEIEEFEKGYSFRRIIKDGKTIYQLLLKHAPQNVLVSKLTKSGWDIYKLSDEGETIKLHETSFGKLKDAQLFVVNNDIRDMMSNEENNKEAADIEITSSDKAIGSSTRFRPFERVVFSPPITGPSGAQLIGYQWAYEFIEEPAKEGDTIVKRISDWTQAIISADTGRNIVHQFEIKLPDNQIKTVSSESVLIILGYTERNTSANFPKLSSAVKTLAKLKLKLTALESQNEIYEDVLKELKSRELPPIILKEHKPGEMGGVTVWEMGDVNVWESDEGKYDEKLGKSIYTKPETISEERKQTLIDAWERNELDKRGIKKVRGIHELKERIERQKRKVDEISKNMSQEIISAQPQPPILETKFYNVKDCLLSDTDNQNDYIIEGTKIYSGSGDKSISWEVVKLSKENIELKHNPANILDEARPNRTVSYDELKSMFEKKHISIPGIETMQALNHCIKAIQNCLDKIDLEAYKKDTETRLQLAQEELEKLREETKKDNYSQALQEFYTDLKTNATLISKMPISEFNDWMLEHHNLIYMNNIRDMKYVSPSAQDDMLMHYQDVAKKFLKDENVSQASVNIEDYKSALEGAETALEFAEEADKQNLIDYIEGLKVVIETMQN